MGVSLRIGAWLLATIAVIVAALNFFFFWKLSPGASEVLPASVALAGTLIGAALTIELQFYTGGVEYSRKIRMYELDREQQMRLAALDKRLHAHQEAYGILQGYQDERYVSALVGYCSDAEKTLIYNTEYSPKLFLALAERWYSGNCLYLEREVDVKFRAVLDGQCSYESAHDAIRKAVYLPGITIGNMKEASRHSLDIDPAD